MSSELKKERQKNWLLYLAIMGSVFYCVFVLSRIETISNYLFSITSQFSHSRVPDYRHFGFKNHLIFTAVILGIYSFHRITHYRITAPKNRLVFIVSVLLSVSFFLGGGYYDFFLDNLSHSEFKSGVYAFCYIFFFLVLIWQVNSITSISMNHKEDILSDPIREKIKEKMKIIKVIKTKPKDDPDRIIWKVRNGWFAINNSRRGILFVGVAGSGKSYSVGDPIIEHAVYKNGLPTMIYDFKYPTLSKIAYESYLNRLNANKLHYHNFFPGDIKCSNSINPFDIEYLKTVDDVSQSCKTLLLNINKTWKQKDGDFFSDSAQTIYKSVVWFLRNFQYKTGWIVSSLPHSIEISSNQNYEMLIEVLMKDKNTKSMMSALATALGSGANEQLGGQLGSLQIALSKAVNDNIYFLMSGESDFPLAINKKEYKIVFTLGNDPEKSEAFAPVLSLICGILKTQINAQGREKCFVHIDELPTIYIEGLAELPNTGRSNGISTVLGVQNLAQLEASFGKKEADVLKGSFGGILIGQVGDEQTANFATKLLGQYQKKRYNESINTDQEKSYSEQRDRKNIVEVEEMMALNPGEFVGKTESSDQETRLYNKFIIDEGKKIKGDVKLPILNKRYLKAKSDIDKKFAQEAKRKELIRSDIDQIKHFDTLTERNKKELEKYYHKDRVFLTDISNKSEKSISKFVSENILQKEYQKMEDKIVSSRKEEVTEESEKVLVYSFCLMAIFDKFFKDETTIGKFFLVENESQQYKEIKDRKIIDVFEKEDFLSFKSIENKIKPIYKLYKEGILDLKEDFTYSDLNQQTKKEAQKICGQTIALDDEERKKLESITA